MPEPDAQRSGPASNRRSSPSVYLVTSGLEATTPLMSGRATLIEAPQRRFEQENQSADFRNPEEPTSEQHPKSLLHHLFLLFLTAQCQNRKEVARPVPSVVLAENAFGSRPGSRNEPGQHSTAISLRIAHYRSTSSVHEACATKTLDSTCS